MQMDKNGRVGLHTEIETEGSKMENGERGGGGGSNTFTSSGKLISFPKARGTNMAGGWEEGERAC